MNKKRKRCLEIMNQQIEKDPLCQELKHINMTGRLIWLFMCIEKYLLTVYPKKDWTPVAEKCWQWINCDWDTGFENYSTVIPEYLFEFDHWEDTERSFEGKLSKEEYRILTELFSGITEGNEEDEINQVLKLPYAVWSATEGTNFEAADFHVLWILFHMKRYLELHGISLPDIDKLRSLTLQERGGWGEERDGKIFSVIL